MLAQQGIVVSRVRLGGDSVLGIAGISKRDERVSA